MHVDALACVQAFESLLSLDDVKCFALAPSACAHARLLFALLQLFYSWKHMCLYCDAQLALPSLCGWRSGAITRILITFISTPASRT